MTLATAVPLVVVLGIFLALRGAGTPEVPEYRVLVAGGPSLQLVDTDAWRARGLATGMRAYAPTLSPDGGTVIYAAGEVSEGTALWSMPVPAGPSTSPEPVRISSPRNATAPRFSPDGTTIAFVQDTDDRPGIWTMRPDGTGQRQLTGGPGVVDAHPAWSPDGDRIAFERIQGDRATLLSMAPDGTDVRRVADIGARDQVSPNGVTWSPDGTTIVYSDGDDLWRVPATGGTAERLTDGPERDWTPSFSPEGSQIAFLRWGEGIRTLSLAEPDESRLVVPSHSTGDDVLFTSVEWGS